MPSERIQRQIDALLHEAAAAVQRSDWPAVRARAQAAQALDPENADAQSYLAAADRALSGRHTPTPEPAPVLTSTPPELRMSFAGGHYQLLRLLGEGGKKRVFLARDTVLNRNIAFALIRTDGIDEDGLASGGRPRPWPSSATIPTSSPSTMSGRTLRQAQGRVASRIS